MDDQLHGIPRSSRRVIGRGWQTINAGGSGLNSRRLSNEHEHTRFAAVLSDGRGLYGRSASALYPLLQNRALVCLDGFQQHLWSRAITKYRDAGLGRRRFVREHQVEA